MSEQTDEQKQQAARREMFKRARLVIGLVVVVGLFYVFMGSATQGGQWFMEVDEAVAATIPPDRPIRVKGDVAAGSYRTTEGTTLHRFAIIGKTEAAMPVLYDGAMPDVFAEGREVVVEGMLKADGTLVATEVIAKCPSKYEGGLSPEARQQLEATGQKPGQPHGEKSGQKPYGDSAGGY